MKYQQLYPGPQQGSMWPFSMTVTIAQRPARDSTIVVCVTEYINYFEICLKVDIFVYRIPRGYKRSKKKYVFIIFFNPWHWAQTDSFLPSLDFHFLHWFKSKKRHWHNTDFSSVYFFFFHNPNWVTTRCPIRNSTCPCDVRSYVNHISSKFLILEFSCRKNDCIWSTHYLVMSSWMQDHATCTGRW